MAVDISQAPVSSPPASASGDSTPVPQLDDQILAIRAEIAKLRAHKSRLSSTLLGSTKIQKCIQLRKTHYQRSRAQNSTSSNSDADSLQTRLEEAVQTQQNENDNRIHRLAYGITAFPFTDPSPERAGEPTLTGVRFDLGGLNPSQLRSDGNNDKTTSTSTNSTPDSYFIILKRVRQRKTGDNDTHHTTTYLKVHHHTIPAHIDLEGLTAKYLPLPLELQDTDTAMDIDEQEESSSRRQSESFNDDSGIDVTQDITNVINALTAPASTNSVPAQDPSSRVRVRGNGQDVHKFIFAVRDDLQSWHYRTRSIAYLREAIGLPPQRTLDSPGDHEDDNEDEDGEQNAISSGPEVSNGNGNQSPTTKYSIMEVTRTTADAYQVRIVWNDDSLGLLKLSYDGIVDRAIVYGVSRSAIEDEQGDQELQHERLYDIERMLMFDETGGKMHIQNLLDGLKRCDEVFSRS